ncbi:MAG: hypothetical protein ACODAE_11055, partial [Gemmatimonadota bacterium]
MGRLTVTTPRRTTRADRVAVALLGALAALAASGTIAAASAQEPDVPAPDAEREVEPPADRAPSRTCRLVSASNYLARNPGTPRERHYFQGPVHFTCEDDVTLRADSAEGTPPTGRLLLIGDVFYEDSVKTLVADRLDYLRRSDRLHATGDVELIDRRDGSILTGPELEHWGVGVDGEGGDPARDRGPVGDIEPVGEAPVPLGPRPGDVADPAVVGAVSRADESRTVVRGGAHATLRPSRSDSADDGAAAPSQGAAAGERIEPSDTEPDSAAVPLEVDADRIEISGERWFVAVGDVRLRRGASRGFGREAHYDRTTGRLLLDGEARIEDEAFDLLAMRIEAFDAAAGGEPDRVHATGDAVLLAEEMRLRAPDIHVFLREGDLHRLVAVRARSTAGEATGDAALPTAAGDTATPGADSAQGRDGSAAVVAMIDEAGPGSALAADTTAPSRPQVDSPDLDLVADSIDVLAPAQQLERVTAIGDAYAERAADSIPTADALPEIARRDWVRGDTVIGHFGQDTVPAAAGDGDASGAGDRVAT